jgi:hypothetical protein
MQLLASICLGFAMVFVAVADASAQAWSEYRPAGGRYRIEMPGTPEVTTEQVEVRGRELPLMEAEVDLPDATYLVTYIDYPAETIRGLTPEKALENARDGAAQGFKLLSDKSLTVGGYPAREYVVERDQGIILVTRSVFVGARFYQMIVVTVAPGGNADRPPTRRFIDSFKLVTSASQ